MKRLLMMAAGITLLAVAPAVAQDPHHPDAAAPPAAAAPATDVPDDASMHERCKAMMGDAMESRPPHDHGRDKTGAPTWPGGKEPTKEEMAAMHKKCSDMMAKGDAAAPEPN